MLHQSCGLGVFLAIAFLRLFLDKARMVLLCIFWGVHVGDPHKSALQASPSVRHSQMFLLLHQLAIQDCLYGMRHMQRKKVYVYCMSVCGCAHAITGVEVRGQCEEMVSLSTM